MGTRGLAYRFPNFLVVGRTTQCGNLSIFFCLSDFTWNQLLHIHHLNSQYWRLELLKLEKLILRKIWKLEKSSNFHTVNLRTTPQKGFLKAYYHRIVVISHICQIGRKGSKLPWPHLLPHRSPFFNEFCGGGSSSLTRIIKFYTNWYYDDIFRKWVLQSCTRA